MKYLIASDIHGSAFYCGKLLSAFLTEKADRLILLGDILYHGPRNDLPQGYNPKNVIEMLNSMSDKILAIRGNCDTEVDQMVLDFPILADYAVFDLGSRLMYLTHGHNYGPQNPPAFSEDDILLCGHTHIPACDKKEGFVYLNPGSVSIPKENSCHSYMTFDGEHFEWKNLEGQIYNEYSI